MTLDLNWNTERISKITQRIILELEKTSDIFEKEVFEECLLEFESFTTNDDLKNILKSKDDLLISFEFFAEELKFSADEDESLDLFVSSVAKRKVASIIKSPDLSLHIL